MIVLRVEDDPNWTERICCCRGLLSLFPCTLDEPCCVGCVDERELRWFWERGVRPELREDLVDEFC